MENIKTYIIAEAGVNHNGDLKMARRMIKVAAKVGVDAVKFQTFKAVNLVTTTAPKAEYQTSSTSRDETQLTMLQNLEINSKDHENLLECCRHNKIDFLSTPFDLDSVDLLIQLGLQTFKIPSGDITNLPLLRKIGALGKKVLLSTGMSTLNEIADALNFLQEAGTSIKDITVLHCNTEYPTPVEDVNLLAMITIKNSFPGVSVGYSDHTLGIEIPIAAVALGAQVIEKHFTLDKGLPGPDHNASLDPEELQAMVKAIRSIEKAMGEGSKKPTQSELKNRLNIRKSIVASHVINQGETFTEKNITTKRPGTGISPTHFYEILGSRALKNYKPDELIEIS